MRHQVTKDLFAYWSRLKGARAAPDRSDIDPGAIRQILADTFIIEVDAERAFPLRLAGTRFNALWRREQKGASFVDLWREGDRTSVCAALATVIDGVTPIVAGARTLGEEPDSLDVELLLLPLRHFGKTHSRILGSLASIYQPAWLGLRAITPLELVSLRVVEPERKRANAPNHSRFERARAAPGRPRLVVYEGGKP